MSKCSDRKKSEQCVQDFFVDITDFDDADLGCRISLADVADRIDPLSVRFLCFLCFPV
jgi:hypothetical protein